MQLKKILLATDFSDSANVAFDEALFWARSFNAELHLLHVLVLYGDAPGREDDDLSDTYQRLTAAANEEMRGSVAVRSTEGLTIVESQQQDASAGPAILRYARNQGADLIVVGSHGRRGWRRFLVGSVAEEVVRSADCPVLVVHGEESRPNRRLDRILVPFDFSADAQKSLKTATQLAAKFGSHLDLVHVMAEAITTGGQGIPAPGLPADSRVMVDLRAETEELLRRRAAEASTPEHPVEPHLLTGHAPSRIVELAQELSADLILLASHGLTGISRALLGSVSERVVRTATCCPVLVLRRPAGDD
jgi:nucleotide-binding universal stress UspA family protein